MNIDDLLDSAINHWRENKGVGTAFIPKSINDKCFLYGVLQRLYNKSPSAVILIIVGNFNQRLEIIEFLTNQSDEENNKEFKRLIDERYIKIFSYNYVEAEIRNVNQLVTILYHCDTLCDNVIQTLKLSKFRLVILNSLMSNVADMNTIYSICPLLDDFKQNNIDAVRISSPVEEMGIGISIPEDSEEGKLMTYYNEYIATSINVFGNLNIMELARRGDPTTNTSAMVICNNIARDNGWNERLDMSVELNVQIDSIYNPGNIRDRAMQTYDIIRKRSALLSDYSGKLDEIYKIVDEHKDKKILIINRRGEFASKVTDYLNNMSEEPICGNYHDKVDPVPATDVNGNPLFVKSGPNKGERRFISAKAQKTLNEKKFNKGLLHVLSTNSAPDRDLNISVDIIIITSPFCEDIENYLYRLSNVYINNGKVTLYSIFVKNSLEELKFTNKTRNANHTLMTQKINVKIDDNFDYIIAD